jgi:hypothetical protein
MLVHRTDYGYTLLEIGSKGSTKFRILYRIEKNDAAYFFLLHRIGIASQQVLKMELRLSQAAETSL